LSDQVISEMIDEERDSSPSHFAAFRMKVEINIVDFFHTQVADEFFKSELDGFLMSSLIDEVDEDVATIRLNLLLKVLSSRFNLNEVRQPMCNKNDRKGDIQTSRSHSRHGVSAYTSGH